MVDVEGSVECKNLMVMVDDLSGFIWMDITNA